MSEMMTACHRCGVPYDIDAHKFGCPRCERRLIDTHFGLPTHVCDKCGSSYVGKECDCCKRYKEQIDDIMEQIRKLTPKKPRSNASYLVDAATYGYRYVQNQGSAFHKAFELSKKIKKFGLDAHYSPTFDCTGWGHYSREYDPSFLTKKLHIPEYKGEMNMKNVVFEEKQTLRVIRECNEWRDVYTIADTEPTDLFTLCGDQNMRVYMRVAMDEDTFLIKDPNMRPVLDVETGCIEMLDKDEKIFIYDPRGCNLDVGSFLVKKPHEDRY